MAGGIKGFDGQRGGKAVDPLRKAALAVVSEVGDMKDDGFTAYEISKRAINALKKALKL